MARQITVNIPHNLGAEEAQRRISDGFGRMREQMTSGLGAMLRIQEHWEGNRLHFEGGGLGQKMTGRLDVLPDSLRIELDLPEMLAAIGERIAASLKKEGQKLLESK